MHCSVKFPSHVHKWVRRNSSVVGTFSSAAWPSWLLVYLGMESLFPLGIWPLSLTCRFRLRLPRGTTMLRAVSEKLLWSPWKGIWKPPLSSRFPYCFHKVEKDTTPPKPNLNQTSWEKQEMFNPLRHHLSLGRVCSLSSGFSVEQKVFLFWFFFPQLLHTFATEEHETWTYFNN